MINRTTRLLWRRKYRRSRQQVEGMGEQAEEHLERHFFRRLSRLYEVRRFVASWMLLILLLIGIAVVQTRALSKYYQVQKPVPGGIFTEGIIGTFTNANPLYAVGSVDHAVAQMLFGSLLKFDEHSNLTYDLAESWTVDESGKRYTIVLRDNLVWHDGRPMTADDVLFTYQLIQNPDARSPFFNSWQGVKLESPNKRTVIFTLPNVLTSFPHSLTNGIVPKHILERVPITQLRSARFNTAEPVGSGPFKWETVEVRGLNPEDREERIGLVPNPDYYGGSPKIQRFIVRAFRDEGRMLESFEAQEINAMVGLNSIPDSLNQDVAIKKYDIPITGAVMAFFRTSHEQLKDIKVRQALVRAVDTVDLVNGLDFPAIAINSPFLRSHIGYDPKLVQLETNIDEANRLLDEGGWVRGEGGIRTKDNKPLRFRLQAQNISEYTYVLQSLQKAWRVIGADVIVDQSKENDEFQTDVTGHNYDALLYGISLGTDPDVFAYWHSSQANILAANRLNLSEYGSQTADQGLEGGRTRIEPSLRAAKYRPFLEAWRNDAPALALYQPRMIYVVRGGLYNFDPTILNSTTDRLSNVHNWMIRQDKATK